MSFSLNGRVQFSDAAEDGKIKIGNIIDYFQNSSILQSELLGGGLKLREERHRAWLLNAWSIRIHQRPVLAEEIQVSTWPTSFNKVFGYRCFAMAYQTQPDIPIVEGAAEWFLIDTEKGGVTRITEEDTKIYECEPPFGWEEKSIRIRPAVEYEEQPAIHVAKYQLDFNGHVNNAWYVKLALEYISSEENIETVRVVYKLAAKYGDIIHPFVSRKENKTLVDLRNDVGKTYAIIEFGERNG